MPVRLDESKLDRHSRNFGRGELGRPRFANAAEMLASARQIAFHQSLHDVAKIVAEAAKSHRHVEHDDVPRPREQRAHGVRCVRDEHGHEHDRHHGSQPRKDTVPILARIEKALERGCVALERLMDRIKFSQRLELLEQKRRE